MTEDSTSTGLGRAKAAWLARDWPALAALAPGDGAEAAELHALRAAGLARAAKLTEARGALAEALAAGCPPERAMAIMSAGALVSLARHALLSGAPDRAQRLYREADQLAAGTPLDGDAARHALAREKARLGLHQDAIADISALLEEANDHNRISSGESLTLTSTLQLLHNQIGRTIALARSGGAVAADADIEALRERSVAQLGQDLWVLEQTGLKREGFFVEFGATDGVLLSNSFMLEKDFGWTGICAEPNPRFFKDLTENRSCICAPDCILDESGKTVEFVLADEFGGVAEYADADMHVDKRDAYAEQGNVISLVTISLDEFLEKYDAPRRIDYMSIDTEGSEYAILKTFPFEKWDVRLLTIEHNYSDTREKIHDLLAAHGYRRIEKEWDDWYVKES